MKHTQHLYRFKIEILWTGDGDDYDLLINRTRRYGERISVAGYHHGECVARAIDKRRSHRRKRFSDTQPLFVKCIDCDCLIRNRYPRECSDKMLCSARGMQRFKMRMCRVFGVPAHLLETTKYGDV